MKMIIMQGFHSVADVVTNSSSELFAIVGPRAEAELKTIVAQAVGESPEDVKVIPLLTMEHAVEYMLKFTGQSFHRLASALFMSLPSGFPEYREVPFQGGSAWNAWLEASSASDREYDLKMRAYLEAHAGDLSEAFRPSMAVQVWCCEDTDLEQAVELVGDVRIYGNFGWG